MRIKFWGVRGSIPTPGRETIRVGGNTPCVEILTPEEEIIVLDAGTGIRQLGMCLERRGNLRVHLFFTHTHWDHIQGFPFFRPLFNPTNHVTLYGRPGVNTNLEETLAGQMQYQYFPVQISDLEAKIEFVELPDGRVHVNGKTVVEARQFQHPGGVLTYRIERQDRRVLYATDVEHGIPEDKKRLIEFARDVDLLIMDCQFTTSEYAKGRQGWGHSTPDAAVEIARDAGVRRLAMFHHDPTHEDDLLEEIESRMKLIFPGAFLARDSMEIEL